VDRLKINGSLARAALKDLEEKGVIKKVVSHSCGNIYSEWQMLGKRLEFMSANLSNSESGRWWRRLDVGRHG
jgi:hypothetical protein